jgi:Flp pilus assembly protein TadG
VREERCGMRASAGSASVELMALAPILAAFVVAIFHAVGLFSAAMRDAADAAALASERVRAWDEQNAGRGFKRPCLEEIEGAAGPGEVLIAPEAICIP